MSDTPNPSPENQEQPASAKRPASENPLISLAVNIILPAVIMNKASDPDMLGPVTAVLAALLFPLGWSVWEFKNSNRVGFIPILGFFNVFLTGGLTVLKAELIWFAVKEAAMPAVIGLAVLGSQYTAKPLVRTFMLNESMVNVRKLTSALQEKGREQEFDQLMATTAYLLAASFFLSATLNFGLARYILTEPPGTVEFAKQLANMTWLSYPVIVAPTMVITIFALWKMIRGIKQLTGLDMEDIFMQPGGSKS